MSICWLLGIATATAEVRVSAASSLTDVLAEITKKFEQSHKQKLHLSFDASSRLARQISEGGPADLFISADDSWVDYLQTKKMVRKRKHLLSNSLVIIAPVQRTMNLNELAKLSQLSFNQIALAQETVPAGKYASEALKQAGVTISRNKIVTGDNVRQVLAWVARDEADLGIVFKTDMLVEKKVRALLEIPDELHSPVVYSLALLNPKPEARILFDYLSSTEATAIFTQAGFKVKK